MARLRSEWPTLWNVIEEVRSQLPDVMSTDTRLSQQLEQEWAEIRERLRHDPDERIKERAVQWVLVHVFGTPEQMHNDVVFHSQVDRARQMIGLICDA